MQSIYSLVPSSPPESVEAFPISPSFIQVVWGEVPAIHRNGIIVMYEVEYNQSNSSDVGMDTVLVESNVNVLSLNVSGDFATYSVRVRAYTEVGAGPYSSALVVPEEQNGMKRCLYTYSFNLSLHSWDRTKCLAGNGLIWVQ